MRKWSTQEQKDIGKLVVLRGRKLNPVTKSKKKYIKFDGPVADSTEVEAYRDELATFKQFLIQKCISLNLKDDQLKQFAT